MSLQSWLFERETLNRPIGAPSRPPNYTNRDKTVVDRDGAVIAVCQTAAMAQRLAETLERINWRP